MNTIKTSLSKVLTLAVVALTVIITFALNPGEALAGYCCGGGVTYLRYPDEMECNVEVTPGYDYLFAKLHNESPERVKVVDSATGQPTFISPNEYIVLPLPEYGVFYLKEGNGPVDFYCER
ncbi:MAG: hypothetical protein F6K50_21925 [Moorea sp. SIO3I7]|uniref:hypothetical protein n=1 Tax=Moorena sp. SIO3I8 TaxID=2607833 RepID=UPI0013C26FC3|nr:hypothetical protein [Moorena sp. SIO3I8]NEN98076.1 hypothetical protein [Moorena sp. SIO3I7]NEO09684.1 hypothetical protein [Moorena sp. SIO3I8]